MKAVDTSRVAVPEKKQVSGVKVVMLKAQPEPQVEPQPKNAQRIGKAEFDGLGLS